MTGIIVFSSISIFLVVATGIYCISKLVDSCNQKINFVTDWTLEMIRKTESLIDTTEELLLEINSIIYEEEVYNNDGECVSESSDQDC